MTKDIGPWITIYPVWPDDMLTPWFAIGPVFVGNPLKLAGFSVSFGRTAVAIHRRVH